MISSVSQALEQIYQLHHSLVGSIEQWPGIEANPEHEEHQHGDDTYLTRIHVSEPLPFFVERAKANLLHHPEQKHASDDQSDGCQRTDQRDNGERAFKYEKFAYEAVQPGQPQRREHGDAQYTRVNRHDLS